MDFIAAPHCCFLMWDSNTTPINTEGKRHAIDTKKLIYKGGMHGKPIVLTIID
jgi:hypothetical protein